MHLDTLPPDPLPPDPLGTDPPAAGSGRLQSVLALLQHLLPAHTARVAQVPPGHRCTDDRSPRDDEPTQVPLVTGEGREVGHLLLRARDGRPPDPGTWRLLGQVLPLLAEEVDPMRAVLDAVRRVPDVVAGAVLAPDGGCLEIPGLEPHPLLHAGSPVAAAASERIGVCRLDTSFLWPTGARGAALGHVRVTVLDTGGARGGPPTTVLLISPAGDLGGLTPRELEVLGYLVDGAGNPEIAEALVVAQRTVATHVEHILLKLGTPTRTLAAVRAERYGMYVPVGCPPPGPELSWRH